MNLIVINAFVGGITIELGPFAFFIQAGNMPVFDMLDDIGGDGFVANPSAHLRLLAEQATIMADLYDTALVKHVDLSDIAVELAEAVEKMPLPIPNGIAIEIEEKADRCRERVAELLGITEWGPRP